MTFNFSSKKIVHFEYKKFYFFWTKNWRFDIFYQKISHFESKNSPFFDPIFWDFWIFFSPVKWIIFIRIMRKLRKIDRVDPRILIKNHLFFPKSPDRIPKSQILQKSLFSTFSLNGISHFVLNYEIFFMKNWKFQILSLRFNYFLNFLELELNF